VTETVSDQKEADHNTSEGGNTNEAAGNAAEANAAGNAPAQEAPAANEAAGNVSTTADGSTTVIAAPGAEAALKIAAGPGPAVQNEEVTTEIENNNNNESADNGNAADAAVQAAVNTETENTGTGSAVEKAAETKAEIKAEAKAETRVETETKTDEIKVETAKSETETKTESASEVPVNEMKLGTMKTMALAAPAALTAAPETTSEAPEGAENTTEETKEMVPVVNASGLSSREVDAEDTTATDEKLRVHVSNILWNTKGSVNGNVIPSEYNMEMVKGQGKLATGFNSYVGGKNVKSSGFGANYQFLNVFTISSEDGTPVVWETADDGDTIKKVRLDSKGNAFVEMTSGAVYPVEGRDLYIAPVYTATYNWYLNYNYIDNVSTGSGSWSNQGGVSSYSHTFSDPSVKTPQSDYQFEYWKNDETGQIFEAGDKDTYQTSGMKKGETKNVEVYAYWQPSVTVNFNEFGTTKTVEKSFDSINAEDVEVKGDYDHYQFIGWYDSEGNALTGENAVINAPGITKENNTAVKTAADAYWQPSITVNYLDSRNGEIITIDGTNASTEEYGNITVNNNEAAKAAQKYIEDLVLGSNNTLKFLGWFAKKDTAPAAEAEAEAEAEELQAGAKLMAAPSLRSIDEPEVPLAGTIEEGNEIDINDLTDGQEVSGGVFKQLAATKDRVVQSIVDLYARFATSFNVNKTWEDDENRDGKRPESIKVQLLANGIEQGEPVELTSEGGWKYTFDNLEAFDNDGNLIKYSLKEFAVESYESSMTETTLESENAKLNGLLENIDITNTHEPEKIEFTITKTWDDADNKDGIRPESIEVTILADGKALDTVKIASAEDWQKLVGDLYRYENGKEIEYTITESEVAGYKASISGSASEGFGIGNYHKPAEDPKPEKPKDEPKDDQKNAPENDPKNEGSYIPRRNSGSEWTSSADTVIYAGFDAGSEAVESGVLGASREAAEGEVLGANREAGSNDSSVLGANREAQEVLGAARLPQTGSLWWPIPILLVIGSFLIGGGLYSRKRDE